MFGYIKTCTPQLRLCEWEAYRGIYCGLCRTLGRRFGPLARLTLSYGAAQVIAPALAGWMAQASGSFQGALWLTAAVMTAGLLLLACLPRDDAA